MLFAATWTDLEIIILSQVSQTEKKYWMTPFICGIKKRNNTNELKNKKETHREQT